MLDATQLGAALYIPATHPDLQAIASGDKLQYVRTIIFCTEDAVAERDLPKALANLGAALPLLSGDGKRAVFVRVRNPEVMALVLALHGIELASGLVLPKIHADSMEQYLRGLDTPKGRALTLMPTIETREAFCDRDMHALLHVLEREGVRPRVVALRIGGNDLLALLRMRRSRGRTIYDTPIGQVIARLATIFIPSGFALAAPVFEHLDDVATLKSEIVHDLNHGLIGKTAIHPAQVRLIEESYKVDEHDLDAALRILDPSAPGVFRLHQSMCEPATHRPWAQSIITAAERFGRANAA